MNKNDSKESAIKMSLQSSTENNVSSTKINKQDQEDYNDESVSDTSKRRSETKITKGKRDWHANFIESLKLISIEDNQQTMFQNHLSTMRSGSVMSSGRNDACSSTVQSLTFSEK